MPSKNITLTGGTQYNISSIKRVTRMFLEVSRCSHAKQRQIKRRGIRPPKLYSPTLQMNLIQIPRGPVLAQITCFIVIIFFKMQLELIHLLIYTRETR